MLKKKIATVRIRTALAANHELIKFYFELGGDILDKLRISNWGDKMISRLSKDLREDFPDIKGLSVTNLKYCKQFFSFYPKNAGNQGVEAVISQQPVDQIPWGHNIHIFTTIPQKSKKTLDCTAKTC